MLHRFCLLLGLLLFVSGCGSPKAAVVTPPAAPAVDTVAVNFEEAFSAQLDSLHATEMSAVQAQTDLIVEIRDTLNKVAARIPEEPAKVPAPVDPAPSDPPADKTFEETLETPEREEPAKAVETEVVKTSDTFEGLDDVAVKDTDNVVITMEDFAEYAKKRIAAIREDMAAIEKDLAKGSPVKAAADATAWPESLRLVYFYGDPCPYCTVQSPVIDELEAAGVPVRRICAWIPNPNDHEKTLMTEEAEEFKVGTAPQVWICNDESTLHKFDGFVLAEDIIAMAEKLASAPMKTAAVKAIEPVVDDWQLVPETWPATIPVDGTRYPSHSGMVRHLRGHSPGGQNHVNDYYQAYPLEIMTVGQLVTLHETDHSNVVSSRVVSSPVYSSQPMFYSQPQATRQFFRSTTRRGCRGGNCP